MLTKMILETRGRPLTRVFMESVLMGAFCVWGLNVCEPDPCIDDNAIFLPQEAKCLVPINNAKDWIRAEAKCEKSGGSLYRLRGRGGGGGRGEGGGEGLLPEPGVQRCLASLGREGQVGQDYWIGTVSVWSKHWMWVNGSLLNPIRYVTSDSDAFGTSQSTFEVCSRYLSVDYCVSVCHDDASAYTVLHWRKGYPCCLCSFRLDRGRANVSHNSYFQPDRLSYYIAASKEGQGSLIRLVGSETFSETETMCATVDTDTYSRRELRSQTCFSQAPFLCSLGTNPALSCDTTNCEHAQCRFRIRDECVQRDSRPMTWFRARLECQALGGDLWTVGKLDDMYQTSRYLQTGTVYWVGATDHVRSFDPESHIFGPQDPDYEIVRCGHMFLERSRAGAQASQWKWSDSRCDQYKSYLCQYEQTTHTSADTKEAVICPWTIPDQSVSPSVPTDASPITDAVVSTSDAGITAPEKTTSTSASTGKSVSTAGHVSTSPTGTTASEETTASSASTGVPDISSVPVVAIVAACVAALVILLCAFFALGYSRRRKWLLKKWRRARDRIWPQWFATIRPTYLSADHSSEQGFDSFSTGFPAVHSETGSVFVPSGSPTFPDPTSHPDDSSAHKTHGHAQARSKDGTKSGDALERLRERLQGHVGSSGHRDDEDTVRAGNLQGRDFPVLGSITENRPMSTSYASVESGTARDYMTLSAHMNIHDDAESPSPSVRMKPEVALVTGDVDLHLTVNHAYTHNPREEGEGMVERGVDEIDLPMTPTLQIPTRSVEETILHL